MTSEIPLYDLVHDITFIREPQPSWVYAVTQNGNQTQILDIASNVTTTYTDLDRIFFTDHALALDVGMGQVAGEAYRLYQAAFDRAPDPGGLTFWINTLDVGSPLVNVANEFIHSAEFQSLYGVSPTPTALVTAMYHNVLHRDPDTGGFAYWLDALNHGVSTPELLASFSESAENVAALASLIGHGVPYVSAF